MLPLVVDLYTTNLLRLQITNWLYVQQMC